MQGPTLSQLTANIASLLHDCFPLSPPWDSKIWGQITSTVPDGTTLLKGADSATIRGVAMSGTGNGDSFLRVNAVRTAGAMVRFSGQRISLAEAIRRVAGRGGELQQSAEDRWGTGEGEGGIIGIELTNSRGTISWDFNCGGLFRAWIDDEGSERCMIFRDK